MKSHSKLIAAIIAVALVAAGLITWVIKDMNSPGELDEFVACLEESGTKFYGAFWCPHCQDQKAMFGKSAKKLPYIECSTPDGQGQLLECEEEDIQGYPTWKFADGSIANGTQSLESLAEKTSCTLPVS